MTCSEKWNEQSTNKHTHKKVTQNIRTEGKRVNRRIRWGEKKIVDTRKRYFEMQPDEKITYSEQFIRTHKCLTKLGKKNPNNNKKKHTETTQRGNQSIGRHAPYHASPSTI